MNRVSLPLTIYNHNTLLKNLSLLKALLFMAAWNDTVILKVYKYYVWIATMQKATSLKLVLYTIHNFAGKEGLEPPIPFGLLVQSQATLPICPLPNCRLSDVCSSLFSQRRNQKDVLYRLVHYYTSYANGRQYPHLEQYCLPFLSTAIILFSGLW